MKIFSLLFLVFFSGITLQAQNKKPPIRVPDNNDTKKGPPIRILSNDAKKSIAAKAADANSKIKCNELVSEIPVEIKSSTGANGYYIKCNASNAVIFYLVNTRTAVLNSGNIRTKYATQDYERGSLGFPVADEKWFLFNVYQNFETGIIYSYPVNNKTVAFIVKGNIYKHFHSLGGDKVTGRPTEDEQTKNGIVTQHFEKGVITQTGNTCIFKNTLAAALGSNSGTTGDYSVPGEILMNTFLVKGKKNYSGDKRYYLIFQEDGNLVLYKVATNKAIWNSHTNGIAIKTCIFQNDGNFVMYGYNGKAVWNSDASLEEYKLGGPIYKLEIQNDGNLVIYACDAQGHPKKGIRWATGTTEVN